MPLVAFIAVSQCNSCLTAETKHDHFFSFQFKLLAFEVKFRFVLLKFNFVCFFHFDSNKNNFLFRISKYWYQIIGTFESKVLIGSLNWSYFKCVESFHSSQLTPFFLISSVSLSWFSFRTHIKLCWIWVCCSVLIHRSKWW